ncbi:MAG: phosphodiester glycosidase family protein [Bacilli bacterium]|nr:phosphodiester glycosidase family protein [Bacilli bacterium]
MNQEVKIINGYKVKDEKARNDINVINTDNPYYDEITYKKERHYDTDCYITTIPLNDNNNVQINPFIGYSNTKSPTEYARDNYTTLTINASAGIRDLDTDDVENPSVISNGEIIKQNDMVGKNISHYALYVGIKADRSISEYPIYNTTAQQMLNDGIIQAFHSYFKLVENGTAVDLTDVTYGDGTSATGNLSPRQAIGIKSDKTIIIITCDGRTAENKGLYNTDLQQLLIDKGCVNAWNLDGGGSSSTSIKGIKINRNIDDDGTVDRVIKYTLNVKKENNLNEIILKAFSKIGEVKQDLLQQILTDVIKNGSENLTSKDVDDLVGKIYVGYGNNLTNIPITTSGYFVNIPHFDENSNDRYNIQFYFVRDSQRYYSRVMVNGNFTEWCQLTNDVKVFYNSGGNQLISADDTYEKLHFISTSVGQSQTNIINVDTTSIDTDNTNYKQFKVNKVGFIKIEAIINLVPKSSDGDRYLRISRNNSSLEQIRYYCETDKAVALHIIAFIKNDDVDNVYSVELQGKQSDVILKTRIFAETK